MNDSNRRGDAPHPYDELPYRSLPIEWLAPERLALASRLHAGPSTTLTHYRYIELGCGSGANILPLAYFRPQAQFVALDSSKVACDALREQVQQLGLNNLQVIQADFEQPSPELTGHFDFVVAHGVFSWIPDAARQHLLSLCKHLLAPNGLLYLSYNARPGWDMRGLVRSFLVNHTQDAKGPAARARLAQDFAACLIPPLTQTEHPFAQLLANELSLVRDAHFSYVGHDYLAEHNHPFWRRDFLNLLQSHGFSHIADADHNYSSGRVLEHVVTGVRSLGLPAAAATDALDLMIYRQFHCPLLGHTPLQPAELTDQELGELYVASCLDFDATKNSFVHPNGYQVDAREEPLRSALQTLRTVWPQAKQLQSCIPGFAPLREDLLLLHNSGMIELRLGEPPAPIDPTPLHALESARGGYRTSPRHTLTMDEVGKHD